MFEPSYTPSSMLPAKEHASLDTRSAPHSEALASSMICEKTSISQDAIARDKPNDRAARGQGSEVASNSALTREQAFAHALVTEEGQRLYKEDKAQRLGF